MTSDDAHLLDYVVIGAGPAGVQLAYFLERRGVDYVVLEAGDAPGTFFKTYPRHRTLISINKVHTGVTRTQTNLRWDWNSLLCDDDRLLMKHYSTAYFPPASAFVDYLRDFASAQRLKVRYNTAVHRISRRDGVFRIATARGMELGARRLVVATGLGKFSVPSFPGVEHAEIYPSVSVNPQDFVGQRVLIVGKGNSGLETADRLTETASVIHLLSPHPVRMAWKTHYVGDVRAVNNNLLDTYQLKSQNTILDATIDKVERSSDGRLRVDFTYSHAEGQRWNVIVDRLILCTGFKFDDCMFDDSARPATVVGGKYPDLTVEWESTNIRDLYFAGTLMHGRDYRKTFSGFIHGFRYNIECMDRLLRRRYHGEPLVDEEVPCACPSFSSFVIRRVNTVSSLFQQPGFLADLFVLPRSGDTSSAHFYRDLPLDFVRSDEVFRRERVLALTMEYGKLAANEDPFNVYRLPTRGDQSKFIHPVLRLFDCGEPGFEYHVPEDLENDWDKEMYIGPLEQFLRDVTPVAAVAKV